MKNSRDQWWKPGSPDNMYIYLYTHISIYTVCYVQQECFLVSEGRKNIILYPFLEEEIENRKRRDQWWEERKIGDVLLTSGDSNSGDLVDMFRLSWWGGVSVSVSVSVSVLWGEFLLETWLTHSRKTLQQQSPSLLVLLVKKYKHWRLTTSRDPCW